MLTEASQQALENLRSIDNLSWYVVVLLALTVYVYANEIERRNWSLVFAGLAFWGMDWINEIVNGIILAVTERSALWTTPDHSAYIILIGLSIEICCMFSIAGIAFAKLLPKDKSLKILGLPNRLVFAIANSVFAVFVEVLLNQANLLIWEYPFWNWPHVWLIIIFGYLTFNVVAFWVYDMDSFKKQATAVGVIWGVAALLVVVFGFGLGWL